MENPGIAFEPIKEEEFVLILSPKHPLAKEGVVRKGCKYPWLDVRRFKNEDFIGLEGSQRSKDIAESIFSDYGMKPNVLLTLRNLSTLVQLVAAGYGFSFVLESHVRNTPEQQRPLCFSIGEPCITFTTVAAFRKGSYHPQYERDFIQMVKELYSSRD